jgi:hypothetical protein
MVVGGIYKKMGMLKIKRSCMKNHHSMHKVLVIGLLAVAAIAGVMFVKNRFGGMGSMMHMHQSSGDVIIMNDSSEAMSVEYKEDGKDIDEVVQPGKSVSGGHGFIKIFTAKKAGAYELTYDYPHAAQQVTISEIIAAAKKDKMEGELYTRRGMIGDIKVFYEEVEEE